MAITWILPAITSDNFFTTPDDSLTAFFADPAAFPVLFPAFTALAYSRLILCFWIRFCASFFLFAGFISGDFAAANAPSSMKSLLFLAESQDCFDTFSMMKSCMQLIPCIPDSEASVPLFSSSSPFCS